MKKQSEKIEQLNKILSNENLVIPSLIDFFHN
jgi:hypothetical protein